MLFDYTWWVINPLLCLINPYVTYVHTFTINWSLSHIFTSSQTKILKTLQSIFTQNLWSKIWINFYQISSQYMQANQTTKYQILYFVHMVLFYNFISLLLESSEDDNFKALKFLTSIFIYFYFIYSLYRLPK